jgi:large subunit ribosomal protein L9
MEVILLERIAKLGQMGDTVRVKDGFARNYLLPKGKALRATEANKAKFQAMKAELEARNLERKGEAQQVASRLDGQNFTVLRQAAETGQLYGSVSARDLAGILSNAGFLVDRSQIALNAPIKMIGRHQVSILLHPEVEVTVTINVGRNAEEAERLARGEDITVAPGAAPAAAEGEAGAEEATTAFFEPEAKKAGRERTPENPPRESGTAPADKS